jgi:hypothetical protein
MTQEAADNLVRWLKGMGVAYDRVTELASLPPGKFANALGNIEAAMRKSNPLAALMLPALPSALEYLDRADLRLALLQAAVAVVQEGPDAVKRFKDPMGDGPFEYKALPDGFELKSKRIVGKEPVALTVRGR